MKKREIRIIYIRVLKKVLMLSCVNLALIRSFHISSTGMYRSKSKTVTPIKANSKLFVIDGGLSKAYQATTGIAGYTLIFNSHELALAEHHAFDPAKESGSYLPEIHVVKSMPRRLRISDTDQGREIIAQIYDLKALIDAYRRGDIRTDLY